MNKFLCLYTHDLMGDVCIYEPNKIIPHDSSICEWCARDAGDGFNRKCSYYQMEVLIQAFSEPLTCQLD